MQRLRCPACLVPPPPSTRAYDRCPSCAGALVREARCAWCLTWTTETACGECTAELVPLPDFGAARMLRSGGVDRYALPERVKALSRNQHGALSARFDEEWGALQPRLEEARFVASFLITRGHVDELETALLSVVPMSKELRAEMTGPPHPPFTEAGQLATITEKSPFPGVTLLSTIAQVHTHTADHDVQRQVAWRSAYETSERGGEAVLATARAALIDQLEPRLDREDVERMSANLDRIAAQPGAAPWVAVARAWLLGPRRRYGRAEVQAEAEAAFQALAPELRAALGGRADGDLRLCAALLLEDEPTLAKILGDADERRRERARRVLSAMGSDAIARDLADGDDEARRQIIRSLRHPLGTLQLESLLRVVERTPAVREEALRRLKSDRFERISEAQRARLGTWVAEVDDAVLTDAWLLDLMVWVTEPTEQKSDAPPSVEPDRRPWIDAVTRRLGALGPGPRSEVLKQHGYAFSRWLRVAPLDHVARILDVWARDPAAATPALDACIELHGRLNGWGVPPDDRGWMLAVGVLDRGGEREAALLSAVLGRHRGISGRERIVEGLWARFRQEPARRSLIMTAAAPYRDELKELRRTLDATGPLSPADPAAFFALYAEADPLDAPALVREAVEALPDTHHGPLVPLLEAVVAYAEPRLTSWPCTVTRVFANVAAEIANRFRRTSDEPTGDEGDEAAREHAALVLAAAAVRTAWRDRLAALTAAPAPVVEDEARFSHVVEHIEVELRLIDEHEARRVEARQYAEARERERLQREEERREREEEIARARADAERMRADMERQQAAQAAHATLGAAELLKLVPDIPREGIDREPLLPDQPLPTLEDYARLLKAMQRGGDVMALFAAAGLTPITWAACAGAWTQVIMARPHVGMRFAALLGASWSPGGG